jgi:hypothetical protein
MVEKVQGARRTALRSSLILRFELDACPPLFVLAAHHVSSQALSEAERELPLHQPLPLGHLEAGAGQDGGQRGERVWTPTAAQEQLCSRVLSEQ